MMNAFCRLAFGLLAGVVLLPAGATAQELPTAVMLRTHAGDGVAEGTARGYDRVLRQRIDAAGQVRIEGSVELDLEAVQLALGCIGESESCLRAVATETGGTLLVFSSIDASGDDRIVSVLLFDSRDGSVHRAVRTVSGDGAVLATAEPIVAELWELPEVETGGEEPPPPPPATPGLSPLPFVLIAVGALAVIGGGVALGLGLSDRDRFATYRFDMPYPTMQQIDESIGILSQSQTELLAATVLLVVGGAVTIGGIGWALGAGREDGSSPLSLLPFVSPDGGGFVLAGALPSFDLAGGSL